ncbi:MAG TPA: L,D-transpeptidase [Rhodoblastus sp.]|nr:L,D-transpeptidase [Rhodoblastus sp.]
MKRVVFAVLALFGASFAMIAAAQAKVQIHIDLSSQRMTVDSASGSYVWPVSTARSGYVTPRGSYRPTSLQRMHYSRKYHMSPMPHSIFFRGGYAIHGTYATSQLGSPASHGCIRLSPANAAALFAMVQQEGASISISGSAPNRVYASARKKHHVHYARGGHKTYKHYASRSRTRAPLAYAPAPVRHYYGGVRGWQFDPAGRY